MIQMCSEVIKETSCSLIIFIIAQYTLNLHSLFHFQPSYTFCIKLLVQHTVSWVKYNDNNNNSFNINFYLNTLTQSEENHNKYAKKKKKLLKEDIIIILFTFFFNQSTFKIYFNSTITFKMNESVIILLAQVTQSLYNFIIIRESKHLSSIFHFFQRHSAKKKI